MQLNRFFRMGVIIQVHYLEESSNRMGDFLGSPPVAPFKSLKKKGKKNKIDSPKYTFLQLYPNLINDRYERKLMNLQKGILPPLDFTSFRRLNDSPLFIFSSSKQPSVEKKKNLLHYSFCFPNSN